MALEGQLSDFNVAEILQLIAGQKKSGFLMLEGRRTMVFVFDKGTLITTRDRRDKQTDTLETYLQAYGYLTDAQWRNIEYIKENSSLDLTEILISEEIFDEARTMDILRSLAQEMLHDAMKLRKGRYQFTATQGAPRGIRGRIAMDVQGLLMEGARRLDEETRLAEVFPSPVISFRNCPVAPDVDGWDDTRIRLYRLALTGEPLGKIIRFCQLDAFRAREQLHAMCEDGFLTLVMPGVEPEKDSRDEGRKRREKPRTGPRSVTLTILVMLMMLGTGFLRWAPLFGTGIERAGLAPAIADSTEAAAVLDEARALRLRQIEDEVDEALTIFLHRHGRYPADLGVLAREGLLPEPVHNLITELNWTYRLREDGRGYSLAA